MRLLLLILGSAFTGNYGFADSLKLTGVPYRPSAPIIWAVTNNTLPKTIWVLKDFPKAFSERAVSNAMAMGSFKPLNRMKSQEKGLLYFQDNRDKTYMTRYLKMSSANGAISYYDGRAAGKTVTNVPSFEETTRLAVDYFSRLGGDTNQILPKPMSRTEGTVRSLERKTGRESEKVVNQRGVILYRQVHGIQVSGGSFCRIEFVSNAKIPDLEMNWRNFEDDRSYPVATPDEIMNWIKDGRAVNPSPVPIPIQDINHAQKLIITKVTPYYSGEPHGQSQEFVYPFGEIELIADVGSSKISFQLHCPIIEIKQQ